jgi:hypothetical protein
MQTEFDKLIVENKMTTFAQSIPNLSAQKEEVEIKDGVLKNYLHFHGFDSILKYIRT